MKKLYNEWYFGCVLSFFIVAVIANGACCGLLVYGALFITIEIFNLITGSENAVVNESTFNLFIGLGILIIAPISLIRVIPVLNKLYNEHFNKV